MENAWQEPRVRHGVAGAVLALLLLGGCGSGAASGSGTSSAGKTAGQGSAATFYKGQAITWIVPYKAGGGFDVISRMLAPYMQKYTGAKVVVENKPGAGGLVGVNDMSTAKPDGLSIAMVNAVGAVATQIEKTHGMQKAQGMRFNLLKLAWLGRVTPHVALVYVAPNSPLKSIKDIIKSKRELRWGATGPGAANYIVAEVLEKVLHVKFNIVTGFSNSSSVMAAVAQQEVDLASVSDDSGYHKVASGLIRPLFVVDTGTDALFPHTPTLAQLKSSVSTASWKLLTSFAETNATGRAIATQANVPPDRLAFLRAALKKAMADPALIAAAKKRHYDLVYASGAQELTFLKKSLNAPAPLQNVFLK